MFSSSNARFLLSGSDINLMIQKLIEDEIANDPKLQIEEVNAEIKSNHTYQQIITYYIFQKKINHEIRKFILMTPSRDAATLKSKELPFISYFSTENIENLPYIGDVIKEVFNYADKKKLAINEYELLLPMRQCRGWFSLPTQIPFVQKQHFVFCIMDFRNNKVNVYDAHQDYYLKALKSIYYPDKLVQEILPSLSKQNVLEKAEDTIDNDLPEQKEAEDCSNNDWKYEYQFLKSQEMTEKVVCGFYVNEYLKSYLTEGDDHVFKSIKIKREVKPEVKPEVANDQNTIYIGTESKADYIKSILKEDYIPGVPSKSLDIPMSHHRTNSQDLIAEFEYIASSPQSFYGSPFNPSLFASKRSASLSEDCMQILPSPNNIATKVYS